MFAASGDRGESFWSDLVDTRGLSCCPHRHHVALREKGEGEGGGQVLLVFITDMVGVLNAGSQAPQRAKRHGLLTRLQDLEHAVQLCSDSLQEYQCVRSVSFQELSLDHGRCSLTTDVPRALRLPIHDQRHNLHPSLHGLPLRALARHALDPAHVEVQ